MNKSDAFNTSGPYPDQPNNYPDQPNNYPQQPNNYPQQLYNPQQQPYNPQQQPYNPQQQPYSHHAYPQQQQQPGMMPGPQVVILANRTFLNFTGAIILSCIVYWCCFGLFGLIAFILAMVGQSTASSGDARTAKNLLVASYVLSAVGILVAVAIAIAIGVYFGVVMNKLVETSFNGAFVE